MKICFLLLIPFLGFSQSGFDFVNISGIIKFTKKDTIIVGGRTQYVSSTREFSDSTKAALYMEVIKSQLLETATQHSALAKADSISARRLDVIGTDSGLFFASEKVKPPDKVPELIILPDQPKKKTTKPKTKKKL